MKRILFLTVLIFSTILLNAQANEFVVKNSNKGLYFEHIVIAKENFYSIGRLFNVPPKELAAFNALDMTKGLSIAQNIHIPLTQANFSQSIESSGIPIYYKAVEKESLLHISLNNNNVLLENLRKWNKLSSDNVSVGTKLIVGYLYAGEITGTVAKNEHATEEKKPDRAVVKEEKKADVKEEKKPDLTREEKKQDTIVVVKEKKKADEKVENNSVVVETKPTEVVKENSKSGYFKAYFDLQTKKFPVSKNQTVTSGIFKTASGWQDAKYYALIDKVEPGTVIKVINPSNNKVIYAKVLGGMNGIVQNRGLDLRISNSAAEELNVEESDKFIVKVNY